MAARLGLRTAALTRCHSATDLAGFPREVRTFHLPSPTTTEFLNIYSDSGRTQKVRSIAAPILAGDLPSEAEFARCTLLAPVIDEVDPAMSERLAGAIGIAAQGWLRRRDTDDSVRQSRWQADSALTGALAVFVSPEDVESGVLDNLLEHWLTLVPMAFVTAGPRPGRAFFDNTEHELPVYPAKEVDPTGAGDVFAAAFLARYAETSDPFESMHFAAAAAACSVEGLGISRIPDRAAIAARREARDD